MPFAALHTAEPSRIVARNGVTNDITYSVSGALAPLVTFELAPEQSILCDFDDVRLLDDGISVRSWPSLSQSTRLLVNTTSKPAQTVVLSKGLYGCVGAFDLVHYARRLVCRSSRFLATGPGVMTTSHARHNTHAYGDLEFLALHGDGWAFLHSDGEVFRHRLSAGQTVNINAAALVAMSATVDLAASPRLGRRRGDKEVSGRLAQLTGPGVVWLQSSATHGSPPDARLGKRGKASFKVVS